MKSSVLDCYAASFLDARAKFLASAKTSGGIVETISNPHAQGPDNEELSADIAYFGASGADTFLVMLAGTHGSEGYAASPILIALMQSGLLQALPSGIAVLLVHAINPYGFAHTSRTNENNVDLNRNFIDFSKSIPPNPGYSELHPYLCPPDRSEAGMADAQTQIDKWIEANGHGAFMSSVFNGQYEEPKGVMFGGRQREWSNHMLEWVARTYLGQARKIAFIDWHTGLGTYGNPFFLCFNDYRSAEWERCCAWWGRDQIENLGGFDGADRPRYSGLVFQGMQRFCSQAEFAGAVIEFGTTPPEATIRGLQLDNCLRFAGDSLNDVRRAALQAEIMESFCPLDPVWRVQVVEKALAIIGSALNGLPSWTVLQTAHREPE